MKKRVFIIALITTLILCITANAEDNPYGDPVKIRCTVYTANEGDLTKDGSKVREGIIAGKEEWLGYTAIIYSVNDDGNIGELIGFYEFKDTGSHIGLKRGTRVDIYRDNIDRCNEWVNTYGDYVYIQIVDGKG